MSFWVAGAVVVGSVAQGVMSSQSAGDALDSQEAIEAARTQLLRDQMRNFQKLIKGYPKETREFLSRIAKTYGEITAMIEEAKFAGDNLAADAFKAQKDLVDAHLMAELEAIGANKEELMSTYQGMADEAVSIIMKDEDTRDGLREQYKIQSDAAVSNLNKMAEASGKRIDSILKTGLPPDAAAKLSKVQQGVADLKRRTQELESQRGKGGSASRVTATELEGLKVIGETSAKLREGALNELTTLGQQQQQVQRAAGERMTMLQPTRGAAELAARQPYQMMQAQAAGQAGGQSLVALGNANVATRQITGAEGDSSMAREEQYYRDRMSLIQNQATAEQAVEEREQDLISAATAQTAVQARSMADVMGVQAQNYANMAAQSRADSRAAWATVGRGVAGAAMGYNQVGADGQKLGWGGAGQGALYGMTGVQLPQQKAKG